MDDTSSSENPKRNPITLFAGGCLIVLYLALCIIVVIFGRSQITERNAPTPTITVTTIPHILVHSPSDEKTVTYEDFSSNQRDWSLYYYDGKLEMINGKLILQSNLSNSLTIATSKQIAPMSEKYYLQADFSTDTDSPWPYGIVLGFNKSLITYYVFEIWPQRKNFRLLKFNNGDWTILIPFSQAEIFPFPSTNTLSVYFNAGSIELYINGRLVSKYTDTNFFQSKDIGVFMNHTGYRLIVDDFYIVDEK